ncbi:MAG: GGDEF domain-containing protein [Huintestinicola sp.]
MAERIRKLILNAGLTDDEYKSIKADIMESNMQNITIFSVVAFVFLIAMFIMTFAIDGIVRNRWLYFIAAVIVAFSFVFSGVVFKKSHTAVTVSMYIFIGVIFAFGIILGAVKNTDQLAVSFIAILLTGPMLFTDRPVRMIPVIYISVGAFILTAIQCKSGDSLLGDIVDSVVFGTISAIISTYMMNVKCKKHLYEKRAVMLSETDLLTGLRNRNSYERNISSYPDKYQKDIACVYADVNGLHEMNNAKGHEAGDKMLKFVADSISKRFGVQHTYRIGGDEFVAFAIDSGDDTKKITDDIISEVKSEGYNVSIGYAVGEKGSDMDELIKAAETKMFDAKKIFYAETGYKRRSGIEQFK